MVTQEAAEAMQTLHAGGLDGGTLLAFADQGGNLAGKFFQASLLPYLSFLYFLGQGSNGTPKMGNFGFRYLLLFVVATIPTGIISKVTYGVSLADVDWLHGSAELLLTVTNLLIVYGFRQTMGRGDPTFMDNTVKNVALAILALVGITAATGVPVFHFEAHTAFLAGIGDLPKQILPSFLHAEPANALSIPTWAIHFSSVYEWIFAMGLVWRYAEASGNEKWKGLTWGMLPLHASGIAACTYHWWYNSPDLSFLVALQAGLTCLGNITVAIAAYRIAMSNGFEFKLPSLPGQGGDAPEGGQAQAAAAITPQPSILEQSDASLIAKLSGLTILSAYACKYSELALGEFPFTPNPLVACLMVATPPALVGLNYFKKGSE
eukprot:CAMPEP_0173460066 /NCGR_PEP_ID=MMETSP1357-20121228/62477_1 /TAXON_ID=77926 /ORGANISM="Hemiselmis rufescens, Strain PCC563" /LENGTH=376 /DNA_ID=CAMNT_0014427597 /DNA_START=39 /DNA_END=1169 /DNA_ORIENTATION=-